MKALPQDVLGCFDIPRVWNHLSVFAEWGCWRKYVGDINSDNPAGRLIISRDHRNWVWPAKGVFHGDTFSFTVFALKQLLQPSYEPVGTATRMLLRWHDR